MRTGYPVLPQIQFLLGFGLFVLWLCALRLALAFGAVFLRWIAHGSAAEARIAPATRPPASRVRGAEARAKDKEASDV